MGNNKSRMVEDYAPDKIIDVGEISPGVLGREIIKRCGNEGKHANLKKGGKTTLRFLQAAITFCQEADEAGADLTNAAFMFMLPGREFVIRAGDGDWEFFFSEDDKDEIRGQCVRKGRKTWLHYVKKPFMCIGFLVGSNRDASIAIKNTGPLALTQG